MELSLDILKKTTVFSDGDSPVLAKRVRNWLFSLMPVKVKILLFRFKAKQTYNSIMNSMVAMKASDGGQMKLKTMKGQKALEDTIMNIDVVIDDAKQLEEYAKSDVLVEALQYLSDARAMLVVMLEDGHKAQMLPFRLVKLTKKQVKQKQIPAYKTLF